MLSGVTSSPQAGLSEAKSRFCVRVMKIDFNEYPNRNMTAVFVVEKCVFKFVHCKGLDF